MPKKRCLTSKNRKVYIHLCALRSFMRYFQGVPSQGTYVLDLVDKKVLNCLDENARQSYSQIARKCRISRDKAEYRIKNLEKAGVIQGYRTVVDITQFGYQPYHVFLQLKRPKEKVEKELTAKFKQYPFMRAVIKYSGKYDYELALIAKTIKELDKILDRLLEDCEKYIQSYDVLILTEQIVGRTLPRAFYPKSPGIHFHDQAYQAKISQIDVSIISEISQDPLKTNIAIGKKIKLSHDAVTQRIKNLTKSGVIKRFIPALNYASLSYTVYCVLLRAGGARCNNSKIRELLDQDENVIWAVKTVGRYDLIVYVCIDETSQLHDTVNKLRNYFPDQILEYEVLLAYEEYKYTYFTDYVQL